jgi:hypothetical protein
MIRFSTTIQKFGEQGEKTGWTYVRIPARIAGHLNPGNKKSFRVKGKLDEYAIKGVALMPMGEGEFIMALNTRMRKAIRKTKGAKLILQLEIDHEPIVPPADFLECLTDEPKALAFFNGLSKSHQNYFGTWIKSAKTEPTRIKRIARCIDALSKSYDFGRMMRDRDHEDQDLPG